MGGFFVGKYFGNGMEKKELRPKFVHFQAWFVHLVEFWVRGYCEKCYKIEIYHITNTHWYSASRAELQINHHKTTNRTTTRKTTSTNFEICGLEKL